MFRDLMLQAAKNGGRILLDYFGRDIGCATKESKSSIVTQADIESEKVILEVIQNELPGHNYIAEESGFVNNDAQYTWVIDPLDGTSNFAAGIEWFGVMIALLEGNVPIMGCMYLPCSDVMYVSEKGSGVRRNGQRVSVSRETKLENILCAYCMDYHRNPEITRSQGLAVGMLASQVRNIRATNCLVDFCFTIDGRFGACINRATKIWDIAPVALMLEEAGGILTDLHGEKINFDLTANYLKTYQVMAANHDIIAQLLGIGFLSENID